MLSRINFFIMKKSIHPQYYSNTKVKCACGAVYEIGSTVESMEIEICSNCHPFYTGKQKLVDTSGRVDQFTARMSRAQQVSQSTKHKSKSDKKKALQQKRAQKDDNND